MAAGIRLEWAQFGDFDSFDVIRSDTSMSDLKNSELPTPIATNLKTMYFQDLSASRNSEYYYKVRAWRDNESIVSDQFFYSFYESPKLITYVPNVFTTSSSQKVIIPSETREGDLLIAVVMHRSNLVIPDSWSLLGAAEAIQSTQSQTILFKTASTIDGGLEVNFNQSSNVRIAVAILVFRHEYGCKILDVTTNNNITQADTFNLAPIYKATQRGIGVMCANWVTAPSIGSSTYSINIGNNLQPQVSTDTGNQIRQGISCLEILPNQSILGQISLNVGASYANSASAISFVVTHKKI